MVFIRSLRFASLYSYPEEVEVNLSSTNVIVGPNNSGKSNITRILNLIVDTFSAGKRLMKSEISHIGDDPFVEVKVTLSPQETEKLIDFFSFYPKTPNQSSHFRDLKNREILLQKLNDITVKLLWKKEIHDYGSQPFIEIHFEKLGLWGATSNFGGSLPISNRLLTDSPHQIRTDLFLCDVLGRISGNETDREVLAQISPNDGAYISIERVKYGHDAIMDNKGKSTIQNLYSFMGFPTQTNQEISFHLLLGMIFKKSLSHASGRVSTRDILDVAYELRTFDNNDDFDDKLMRRASSLSLKHTSELLSDGSNLPQYLFHMMVSENYEEKEKFEKIRQAFNDILKADELSLDVALEYQPMESQVNFAGADKPQIPKRPTIQITDKKLGKRLSLKQVGAGLTEIIYLLSVSLGMKNSIILLDEPSVNLHPPMMKALMRYIENPENNNQFIIITHSADLVQYELFESNARIMYVRKSNQISQIAV